jgi:thioredoxin-related protein
MKLLLFSLASLSLLSGPAGCGSGNVVTDSAAVESVPVSETQAVQASPAEPDAVEGIETAPVQEPISSELNWYGIEEGYAKAVAEQKVLLIDAYTEWCGWCKVMDKKTYTDVRVIEALNRDFVCVKFNPEVAKTFSLGGKAFNQTSFHQWLSYGESTGYPTTFFWMQPGKDEVRYNQPGYLEVNDFMRLLALALNSK